MFTKLKFYTKSRNSLFQLFKQLSIKQEQQEQEIKRLRLTCAAWMERCETAEDRLSRSERITGRRWLTLEEEMQDNC